MLKHLDKIITDPFFSALITSYILGAVQVQGPKSVQKQQRGLKLAKDQVLLPSALKNQFELSMEGVRNAQNEVLQIFIPKIAKQENILQQQPMIQEQLVIQKQPMIQQQLKQQQLVIQKQNQLKQQQLEQQQLVIQKQNQLKQQQLEQEQLVIQKQKQLKQLEQEQLVIQKQLEQEQSVSQTMAKPWLEAKLSLHLFLDTLRQNKEVKNQHVVVNMLVSSSFLGGQNLPNSVELRESLKYLTDSLDGLLRANLNNPQIKLDIQNQQQMLRNAQQQYLMLEEKQEEMQAKLEQKQMQHLQHLQMQGDLQRLESKLQLLKMEGNLQQEELQRQGDLGLHGMQADLRTQQEILQWMRRQVDAQNKMENVKQQQMLNNMQAPIQEWQDLASLTARQAQKVLAETQKQLQIARFWLKLNDISTYLNAAPNVLEVFFNDCGINSSYIPTIQTTVATIVHTGNVLKVASTLVGNGIFVMYIEAITVQVAYPIILPYVDSNSYVQNITHYMKDALNSNVLQIWNCSNIADDDLSKTCTKNQNSILSAIDIGVQNVKVGLVTFGITLLHSWIFYGTSGFQIAVGAAFKMGTLNFLNSMLENTTNTAHEVVEKLIAGIIAACATKVTHSFSAFLFVYAVTEYGIDNIPLVSEEVQHLSKMALRWEAYYDNLPNTETNNTSTNPPALGLPDLFSSKTYVDAFGALVLTIDDICANYFWCEKHI